MARAKAGVSETYYREALDVQRDQGVNRHRAFEIVAERHGTTAGNVQTAFYRMARRDSTSDVTFRPRSKSATKPARAARVPSASTNGASTNGSKPGDALRALAADLERSAKLLRHEATSLDAERATLSRIREIAAR